MKLPEGFDIELFETENSAVFSSYQKVKSCEERMESSLLELQTVIEQLENSDAVTARCRKIFSSPQGNLAEVPGCVLYGKELSDCAHKRQGRRNELHVNAVMDGLVAKMMETSEKYLCEARKRMIELESAYSQFNEVMEMVTMTSSAGTGTVTSVGRNRKRNASSDVLKYGDEVLSEGQDWYLFTLQRCVDRRLMELRYALDSYANKM
eukprot:Nk52_evm1s2008 gene=Nk52_evmTU1s2008